MKGCHGWRAGHHFVRRFLAIRAQGAGHLHAQGDDMGWVLKANVIPKLKRGLVKKDLAEPRLALSIIQLGA